MSILRNLVDQAIAEVVADHPKYFTPRGLESARRAMLQKIMAALRDSIGAKADAEQQPAPPPAPELPQPMSVDRGSREGRAFAMLCKAAGAVAPFVTSDGKVIVPAEAATAAVWAFADAPAREQWVFVSDRRAIGAWQEFFRDSLPGIARREICGVDTTTNEWGLWAPWPWPPRTDGTLSPRELPGAA